MFESSSIVNLSDNFSKSTSESQFLPTKLERRPLLVFKAIDFYYFITHVFSIDDCGHLFGCDIWKFLHHINDDQLIWAFLYFCQPLSNKTFQNRLFCLYHSFEFDLWEGCRACFPFHMPFIVSWHKSECRWHQIFKYALKNACLIDKLVFALKGFLCHYRTKYLKNQVTPYIEYDCLVILKPETIWIFRLNKMLCHPDKWCLKRILAFWSDLTVLKQLRKVTYDGSRAARHQGNALLFVKVDFVPEFEAKLIK